MEYNSDIKKNKNLFATAWMDLVGIMRSEISQRKTSAILFTYMWNLKSKINKQNKDQVMDTQIKLMVPRREGCWGTG